MFFRVVVRVWFEFYDELLLLHLDALDDRAGKCVVDGCWTFVLDPRRQHDPADL